MKLRNQNKHHRGRSVLTAAVFLTAILSTAGPSQAFLGDCSQPVSTGTSVVASDCLFILKAAVGALTCSPECICAPKGTLPVRATDALVCLKRAVGQPVALNCPCLVTTTSTTTSTSTSTTTSSMPGSTALWILTKKGSSYATSQLAGTWRIHSIVTGFGAPDRSRGLFTLLPDGSFSGSLNDIDGVPQNLAGNFSVSSGGILSCDVCDANFRGALDAGKTVLAATSTWDDSSTELVLLLKQAANYTQSNLTGTWQLHLLATVPWAPWWSHGPLTIQANGTVSGTLNNSDGSTDPAGGTVALNSNGLALCSGCPSSLFEATMDSDKTVSMMSETLPGGATDLGVMMKQGGNFSQSDLTGTWEVNGIISGFDAGWERGTLTIAANGNISGQTESSLGPPETASGQFVVSPSGIITTPDDPSFRCVMDLGKTVVVCTGFY